MSFVQMKNSPINSPWQPWSEHDAYNAGINEIEHFYHSPCPLTRQFMPSIESVVEGYDCGSIDDDQKEAGDQMSVEPEYHTSAVVPFDIKRTREDSAVAISDPSIRLDGSPSLTTVEDVSEPSNQSFSFESSSSSSDLTELASSPEPPQQTSPRRPDNNLSKKRTRMSSEERVVVEIPLQPPVKRRRIAPLLSQTQFSPRQTRQQRRHKIEGRVRLTRGEEVKRRASVLRDGKMYK